MSEPFYVDWDSHVRASGLSAQTQIQTDMDIGSRVFSILCGLRCIYSLQQRIIKLAEVFKVMEVNGNLCHHTLHGSKDSQMTRKQKLITILRPTSQ